MNTQHDEIPPLNWPYIGVVLVACTAGIAFIGWAVTSQVYAEWSQQKPITGGWSWPSVFAVDALLSLAALALYWKVYCDANTRLGSSTVSRPSIRGVRTIRWSDVTGLSSYGGVGLHIIAGREKITVTPYAYADPRAVIETIRSSVKGAHDA